LAPFGGQAMPAGIGTAADRTLEDAIKKGPLFKQQQQNPLARCLQCFQAKVSAPAGDGKTEEERRLTRRGSKWGAGGEPTRVLERYHNRDIGEQGTLEWRRFIIDEDDTQISYWHDLPLVAGEGTLHAFIEIPKNTRAKYEVCPTEVTNPMKQDEKKGKPRYYNMDIKWNYGALPQTWEQPEHTWKGLEGYAGDDDPVDIVDISSFQIPTGSVIQCKPLAALAMIDEGEVDWKVIVINVADPLAAKVNSLEDCNVFFPGEVDAIREWFTWYKATDPETGKRDDSKKNIFGFEGKALNTAQTWDVIREAHGTWAALVTRQVKCGKRKLS